MCTLWKPKCALAFQTCTGRLAGCCQPAVRGAEHFPTINSVSLKKISEAGMCRGKGVDKEVFVEELGTLPSRQKGASTTCTNLFLFGFGHLRFFFAIFLGFSGVVSFTGLIMNSISAAIACAVSHSSKLSGRLAPCGGHSRGEGRRSRTSSTGRWTLAWMARACRSRAMT